MLFCHLNFFRKFFQECHQSVKQFGSRSWSKLFAKVISWVQQRGSSWIFMGLQWLDINTLPWLRCPKLKAFANSLNTDQVWLLCQAWSVFINCLIILMIKHLTLKCFFFKKFIFPPKMWIKALKITQHKKSHTCNVISCQFNKYYQTSTVTVCDWKWFFLISLPKHMFWIQLREPPQWYNSLELPKHMFKLMDKK